MIGVSSFLCVSIFMSPISITLSNLFATRFNEIFKLEEKSFLLFKWGGIYTKFMHHFFLEMVNPMQIV